MTQPTETAPGERIEVRGLTPGGFPFVFKTQVKSEEYDDAEFLTKLEGQLVHWGAMQPSTNIDGPAPVQGTQGASNGGGGQGGCPVHGFANQKDAYRGGGYECSAYSTKQEPWSKDKPFYHRNSGENRFYCKARWQ